MKIRIFVLSIASMLCLYTPLVADAQEEYKVMGFDGVVHTVADDSIDQIVANIKENSGDNIADLYIEAMAKGDYTEFYEATNDTTEVQAIKEYMEIDGQDMSGKYCNDAVTIESYIQTIYGPTHTAVETGQAAKEAGFEASIKGIQDYWMAILMEKATRPEDAEPTVRASELRYTPRTMEDAELGLKGIITEYEDEPLTSAQKELIDKLGYTIVQAGENTQTISDASPTEASIDNSEDVVQEIQDKKMTHYITPKQFMIILGGIVIASFACMFIFFKIFDIREGNRR